MALAGILIGPFESPPEAGRLQQLELVVRGRGLDARRFDDAAADPASAAALTGVCMAQYAVITDTPAIARRYRSAGLVTLALGSARHSKNELRSAGSRAVYQDVDQLIRELDQALRVASPGELRLTDQAMRNLMNAALDAARTGMEAGEAPIGCAIARGDGQIIATAHNRQNATQNKTAHAEIVCFAEAAGKVPLEANDLILASTLEPCVMCTGAAMEAAVDTILFALRAPADAGAQRVACPVSPEAQMPRFVGGILEAESRALFAQWLQRDIPEQQRRFGEQLLKETDPATATG